MEFFLINFLWLLLSTVAAESVIIDFENEEGNSQAVGLDDHVRPFQLNNNKLE